MFVFMGLSAILPVLHGIQLYGIDNLRQTMGLSWVVLQGFLYVLGAGLYAVSYPGPSAFICPAARLTRPLCSLGVLKDLCLVEWIFGALPTRYFTF